MHVLFDVDGVRLPRYLEIIQKHYSADLCGLIMTLVNFNRPQLKVRCVPLSIVIAYCNTQLCWLVDGGGYANDCIANSCAHKRIVQLCG